MARGYECLVCGGHTVQPKSVNKLQCSKCGTVYNKDVLLDRLAAVRASAGGDSVREQVRRQGRLDEGSR